MVGISLFFFISDVFADTSDVFPDFDLRRLEACATFDEGRDVCYADLCKHDSGYLCAEEILSAVTFSQGPERATDVLTLLENSSLFTLSGGAHQLAHNIGRGTARVFGMNAQSFIRCPVKFEHGCYHGFLEVVLRKIDSPLAAAVRICGTSSAGSNDTFECYHGIGHGITMSESYNLDTSLTVCDALPDQWQKPCWDGVFMEYVEGYFRGDVPDVYNVFRDDDSLAPCNQISERYRSACYEKHASYLDLYHMHSAEDVAEACMRAGDYISSCISGVVGIIGPGSEGGILSGFTGNHYEKVVQLCALFPSEYRMDCYTPAAYVLSLHYGVVGGVAFCMLINEVYRNFCFGAIHTGYIINRIDVDEWAVACAGVPESYQDICLYGYRANDDVEIERCLSSVQENLSVCFASLCEYEVGYLCAEDIIALVTELRGPEVGTDSLREILDGSVFGINTNGHEFAHIVGRVTAQHWGTSGDVFNRCPVDFDYGCLHGFFEIAMTLVDSPVEALMHICADMPVDPMFDRVNCYHGGGHGMMMNESYRLDKALAICDSLPDVFMRRNCWGGVFMENTNGFKNDLVLEEEFNTFSYDNPLAPCNIVEDKYRETCYVLHADYLIEAYSTSVDDLITVCLNAGDYVDTCLRGVARIFSADRQEIILRGSGLDLKGDFVERTFYLCSRFPVLEYVQMCHYFAVSHFIFPDELNIGFERARRYCMLIDFDRERCFEVVGSRLGELVSDEVRMEMCADVSVEYRVACSDVFHERYSMEKKNDDAHSNPLFFHLIQIISSFFLYLAEVFSRPA